MKNVSEFKRELKIGRLLNCTYHQEFNGRDEDGKVIYKDLVREPREISIIQSNSFALKTKKKDGTFTDSWCNYPKASECVFENGVCTIMCEDYRDENKKLIPILSYSF